MISDWSRIILKSCCKISYGVHCKILISLIDDNILMNQFRVGVGCFQRRSGNLNCDLTLMRDWSTALAVLQIFNRFSSHILFILILADFTIFFCYCLVRNCFCPYKDLTVLFSLTGSIWAKSTFTIFLLKNPNFRPSLRWFFGFSLAQSLITFAQTLIKQNNIFSNFMISKATMRILI